METVENFGIIKTGGKQYKVKVGDVLRVEKLSSKDKKLQFDDILSGKKVTAKVVAEGKMPKLRILKFHPKKRYKKVFGARQHFSQIKIMEIS